MSDISHLIQLAVAPVFLLAGIGLLLNSLVSLLGRTVDRHLALAAVLPTLAEGLSGLAKSEVSFLARRVEAIYAAIALSILAALLTCLVIALGFLDALMPAHLARTIAAMFVLSMGALMG